MAGIKITTLGLFEEPKVTKEDAAEPRMYGPGAPDRVFNSGHAHENYYADGFDGGSELPEDIWLDRMVYPHDESPMEKDSRIRQAQRNMEIKAFKEAQFERDRKFRLSERGALGENPAPPSMFDQDTLKEAPEELKEIKRGDEDSETE
jgi:hypothetical protein